jgi:abortive infection bacteriophage resistance protein
VEYDKPHLTLDAQLAKLVSRGLAVPDPIRAMRLLETVGYYRLSAYAYPFRTPLGPESPRETSVQYRSNLFIPGTTFEWIENLWVFDRQLKLLILDAIEIVEIALRSKVGYHLGAHDRFGYLTTDSLNRTACDAFKPDGTDTDDPKLTLFEIWLARYLEHQARATTEDFIKHYVEKYDGKLPIWVATEIMEFGPLVRLYGFMTDTDKSSVSRDVAQTSGAVFGRWMKVANYSRNVSAHHGRLWNRTLTYKIGRLPDNLPLLQHLNLDIRGKKKVYGLAALLAYLTQEIRPEYEWKSRFVSLLNTFPVGIPLSPESAMGFPADWRSLELWGDRPRAS